LDVIHGDEHRSVARQLAESADETDSHCPRLGRCASNIVDEKRGGERPPLRGREGADDVPGIRPEQVARCREGESGLGLRWAARQSKPLTLRELDPISPQCRLPDPRIPLEDKNAGRAFAEEAVDHTHLLLTPDDLGGRPHLAAMVRTERLEVKAVAYCANCPVNRTHSWSAGWTRTVVAVGYAAV
jgi:hypothetical protein